MKLCNGPCAQVKEDQKFYPKRYKNGTVGLRACCIECSSAARNAWRKANKVHDDNRNNAYNKANAQRIRGFKLTQYWPGSTPESALASYEALSRAQKGLCAVCEKPESRKNSAGRPRDLAVDHCHVTGRVRGLLCNRCNRGIGLLKECPQLLIKAVRYLKT